MARPSKLTPTLITKLEGLADNGLDLKELCGKLGIDESTWRRWEATAPDDSPFRPLAARARAGMGSATDDMAWGVLRTVAEDVSCRPSDRLAAAQAILRLRTAHRVEITGKDGGVIDVSVDARSRLEDLLKRSAPKAADDD